MDVVGEKYERRRFQKPLKKFDKSKHANAPVHQSTVYPRLKV
jgi:hypothetical protein